MELKRAIKKIPSEQNLRLLSNLILSLSSKVQSAEDKCITEWEPDVAYIRNQSYVTHENKLYVCVVSCSDSVWTPSHFQVLSDEITEIDLDTVKSWLNLSQEELDNLQKLLKDDQITTTSTFSSSKIFSDIQDAISTVKNYTDTQIGKSKTASYKVVSSESEMTDKSIIYLLEDASNNNFKMYIVQEDGTPKNIGTTDIDLTQFYDKDYIDNNFYTSADADGKFATITTVDGKVDKTDIVDNLTSTDTDKPLSANQGKVLKDEVDLKANDSDVVKKTDISTTIDGTSTNDTVPTNKAVYDGLINKVNNTIVLTTADEVNNFDMAYQSFIMEPPVAEAVGLPKAPDSTWFCINLSHFKGFKYPSQIAFEYAGIERIMYRTAHNGVWHNWKKLCTTGVADVGSTMISSEDSSITGTMAYLVKNGKCYVTIWGVSGTTVGYDHIVYSSMPKCGLASGSVLCAGADGENVAFGHVQGGETSLKINIFKTNKTFFGSFSYPVAE